MDASWHLARSIPVPESGCWLWLGADKGNGYGSARHKGKNFPAHRLSFLMAGRYIPSGMDVCHKCDTRLCINPDHLFVGSRLDNMRDAKAKKRLSHGRSHSALICGEKSGTAKLRLTQVLAIRRAAEAKLPLREIAEIAGVSTDNVRRIVRHDTWKEIKECAA